MRYQLTARKRGGEKIVVVWAGKKQASVRPKDSNFGSKENCLLMEKMFP